MCAAYRLPNDIVRPLIGTKWHHRLARELKFELATLEDASVLRRFVRDVLVPSQPLAHVGGSPASERAADAQVQSYSRITNEAIVDGLVLMLTDENRVCGISCDEICSIADLRGTADTQTWPPPPLTNDLTPFIDTCVAFTSVGAKVHDAIKRKLKRQIASQMPVDVSHFLYNHSAIFLTEYRGANLLSAMMTESVSRARRLGISHIANVSVGAATNLLTQRWGYKPVARLEYSRLTYRDRPIIAESGGSADGGRWATAFVGDVEEIAGILGLEDDELRRASRL